LSRSEPTILRCKVVMGRNTSSSWSLPAGLRPLGASRPTTRSCSRSTRTVWPTGSGVSGKSLRRTVSPMTQTAASWVTSSADRKRPRASFHSRTVCISGVVPHSMVGQVWVRVARVRCVSCTSATPTSRPGGVCLRRAAASSRVSATLSVTAPERVREPERTRMRLRPRLAIRSSSFCSTPSPAATMAMTAAMPMMMPRLVSTERALCTARALTATRTAALRRIAALLPCLPSPGWFSLSSGPRMCPRGVAAWRTWARSGRKGQ
jgi:hypothetical protein